MVAMQAGYEYVLKVRSDLIISNPEKLMENLDPKKLSVMAYHNHDGGYLVDYIVGGPVEKLLEVWNYDTGNDNLFSERILYNRLKAAGFVEVDYLVPKMQELGITCYSLKWARELVRSMQEDHTFSFEEKIV